jgi:hypothetical protein
MPGAMTDAACEQQDTAVERRNVRGPCFWFSPYDPQIFPSLKTSDTYHLRCRFPATSLKLIQFLGLAVRLFR